ncbi:MAG: hypothetical protein N2440_00370 [Actinobacteria bacterium]|nr:hypothetical protein [Actinomycetota bacterium]
MNISKNYSFIKKALLLVLFILGFFIFNLRLLEFKTTPLIISFFILATASIAFGYLKASDYFLFTLGAVLGNLYGYPYGLVTGVLAVLIKSFSERFFNQGNVKTCNFFFEAENFLGSYILGNYVAFPLLAARSPFFYIFVLSLSIYAFYLGLLLVDRRFSYLGIIDKKYRLQFFFLPIVSLAVYLFYLGYYYASTLTFLLAFPFWKALKRFFDFNLQEFVLKQAEYLSKSVFGSEECLSSAKSLAEALEARTNGQLDSKNIYLTYVLSSLIWSPFSRMLYRKPDLLNLNEYALLKSNIENLKELLTICEINEEVIKAVYHLYENYDGSGIPEGLEETEIPEASRYVRVIERYITMTSWIEGAEPLSDEEAIKEIEKDSGIFYDPQAVKVIKEIVMPSIISEEKNEQTSEINGNPVVQENKEVNSEAAFQPDKDQEGSKQ